MQSIIEQILDLARWTPSGDNSQPWRFEILSDRQVRVHSYDQSDHDIYDYDGQPTVLTLGFLLESMRIAASQFGRAMEWRYVKGDGHMHVLEVELASRAGIQENALLPFLTTRSVDRRRYRTTPLTSDQKTALTSALGDELEIRWFESLSDRWRITRVNALATHIRLSIREAFIVHQRILDWDRDFSPDGVPAKSIGLDPLTLKSMRWVMQKWERAQFLNRYAAGTLTPQLEMTVAPGLLCGAHFMVFRKQPPSPEQRTASLLHAGQALQRFWLTATSMGLVLQPSFAPLSFSYYARVDRPFTADMSIQRQARVLATKLSDICAHENSDDLIFMGRMGRPVSSDIRSRSIRRPLADSLIAQTSVPQTKKL